MHDMTKLTTSLLLAGLLSACAENNPDNTPKVKTGVAVGPLLQGLTYQSGDQKGTINELGEFTYREGESVTFSIGGFVLKKATPSSKLSAQALWGTALLENDNVLSELLFDEYAEPIDILVNQMLFLAALDNDGNASNGFNVDQWQTKLASEQLDFQRPVGEFVWKELMPFNDRHNLPKTLAWHGIQELYDSSGIELKRFLVNTGLVIDVRGERQNKQLLSYQYDAAGNTLEERIQYDEEADGSIDSSIVYTSTYNSIGLLVRRYKENDKNNDGTADSLTEKIQEWNASGHQTLEIDKTDRNADGHWERVFNTQNQYNASGQLLRMVHTDTFQGLPSSEALILTKTIQFSYNESGQIQTYEEYVDNTTDGTIDASEVMSYEYDEVGKQIRKVIVDDDNNDGTPERITTNLTTYNEQGQSTHYRQETDTNGDGVIDKVTESQYIYDNNGRTLEHRWLEGTADSLLVKNETIYTRDDQGRLLSRLDRSDTNQDGEFNVVERETYDRSYTDFGRELLEIESIDMRDDGIIDIRTRRAKTYNEIGLRLTSLYERAKSADGPADYRTLETYRYDDDYNLVEDVSVRDLGADDVIENKTTKTFEYSPISTSFDNLFSYLNQQLNQPALR